MQWLGAYTGDGCTNRDHGIRMCIPKTDRVRGHYADLAERLFTKQTAWPTNRKATDGLTGEMVRLRGEGLTYRQIVNRMGLTLHPMSVRDRIKYAQREYGQDRAPVVVAETRNGFQFGSKEAVTWHHDMGVTGAAKTKRVPGWVFGLREDLRLAYLAGVVDTDGSVGKDGRLVIHFANRDLVHDVRMLLVSCGIQCSNIAKYGYTQAALPNPGSQESYEAWRFTASSAVQVARIPFADPLYRARVEANLHRFKADGGTGPGEELGFYTIRSIELEPAEPVYDIEVEDGHSFLVDGVVVHNSNYGMARRKFGDHWGHPQWRSAAQALSSLVDPPSPDVRLGVNTKGIAFLREDAKDLAEIEQIKASTLSTLIMAGYEPDSCVAAVEAEDLTLLKHSGLTSVQLVPPGQDPSVMAEEEAADAEEYDVLLDEFRAELFDDDEIQRDRFAWLKDEIQRRRYYGSLPGERVESGHVGGGQFKELHKRALDAIRRWIADGAPSDADPLEGWKQPQLKKAAEQLGIEVPPRSSPPKLKSAILAHARGDRTPNAKAPAKKATPRAPAKKAAPKPDSVQSARDRQSAIAHARVDGRALRRQFDELAAKVPGKTVPAQEALGRGRLRFGAGDPPGEIAEDLRQAADALEDRQTFGLISPLHFTPAQIEAQRRSDVTGLRRLAKALDKLKPAGPAPGPDSVATARERQAQIDTARMARAEAAVERLRDVTDYAEARELLLSTTSEDDRQLAWHRFVQTPQQRLAVSSEETDETITNRLISSLVPEARRREGPAPIVATQRDAFWGLSKERRARVRERVTDVKSRDQWEAALQAEAPGELESSKERHRAADARLEAARERQAQIDTARTYGDLAAELDELANNEVSAKTLASRIDAFGARHPELTEELAPIRAADPADARRLARELAESHGVKITGQAGDVVPLDRKLHAPIDNTLSGGNVEVIRPGYEITLPDGEVVKVRAKVDRAPDAPAGRPERTRVNSTPKAEPKATPPNPQSPWGQIRDDPRFRWSSVHGRMGNLDQVDAVYVADTREDARAYLETRDDEQLYRIGTAVDIDMRGLDPERDRGAYIERLIDQIREPESAAPDLSSLDTEDLRDTLDLKKLPELKEMLRQRGLKVSGRKRELVDRLVAHERGGTTPDVRALDLGESPTRPSGLPADRKPQSGDFDDLADRVQGKSEGQILEILQDLNATELARLARKFSGSRGGGGLGGSQYKPKGIAIPTDLTLDERRRWLAQRLTAPGWNWRSETPDPDDITRANYDESEDDEPDEDDPGEPGDEQRARAQSLMDEIDDEDEEEPEDEYEAYRAAGMDTNPGGERLHLWWTKGPGLRRWVGSPHPWTTLYRQLLEKVGSPGKAKRMASRWFIEVFGYAAGSDKHRVASGKPPRGDRIGPG
jgi:intracellular sulfur oxidation DsrE/DsrF family protein